ncbi:MAG: Asp-tRNA(Asn)/Glu-tRNA(Gln) amidotransferase subunit GatB [Planctomycetota bacterium]
MSYEVIIGLEVHVQLSTRTKLFCACAVEFGAMPNTRVCPVCLGYPGALPVLNEQAVRLALRAGLAFECDLARWTQFDRKNYFYPDLPKGYQISQLDVPFASGGKVRFDFDGSEREVALRRIHLEEDAGKSMHASAAGGSRIDLNRCGTPLLEMVTEPVIRSPAEAAACLRAIRDLMGWVGVSDVNMEEGSLRCDLNLSLRRVGDTALGTRSEVKNLNSFFHLERAAELEIERQTRQLDAGERVKQETRSFDAERMETRPLRSKEEAEDYRYFPDPDLPPWTVSDEAIAEERDRVPTSPRARRRVYEQQLGLSSVEAGVLLQSRAHSDFFERLLGAGLSARIACNWFQSEVLRELNERRIGIEDFGLSPEQIAAIARAVTEERVSVTVARDVFREAVATRADPEPLLAARGEQVSARDQLEVWVADVLQANPDAVAKLRQGDAKPLGFLVGLVRKASAGRANPRLVTELIQEWIAR